MRTTLVASIVSILSCNNAVGNAAVEQGILALHRRQTADERSSASTHYTNGVGFNQAHARLGTYCAKWILGGNHLSNRNNFLERCRKICIFYAKQLASDTTFTDKVCPVLASEESCYTNGEPPTIRNMKAVSPLTMAEQIALHDPFQSVDTI